MRHFNLEIPDEMLADRQMTRERYYAWRGYLRYLAWKLDSKINWDRFYKHIKDSMIYGTSILNYEDLLT